MNSQKLWYRSGGAARHGAQVSTAHSPCSSTSSGSSATDTASDSTSSCRPRVQTKASWSSAGSASSSRCSRNISVRCVSPSGRYASRVPASRQTNPPACRHPSVTSRNCRYDGGSRRPMRASRAAMPAPGAGAKPNQRFSRASWSPASVTSSGSHASAHSPLHRMRKGRQSYVISAVSVMARSSHPALTTGTDNDADTWVPVVVPQALSAAVLGSVSLRTPAGSMARSGSAPSGVIRAPDRLRAFRLQTFSPYEPVHHRLTSARLRTLLPRTDLGCGSRRRSRGR